MNVNIEEDMKIFLNIFYLKYQRPYDVILHQGVSEVVWILNFKSYERKDCRCAEKRVRQIGRLSGAPFTARTG